MGEIYKQEKTDTTVSTPIEDDIKTEPSITPKPDIVDTTLTTPVADTPKKEDFILTKDKAKQILSSGGELRLHIKRVKDIQPYKNSVFTQADKEYALNLMERAWRTGKIKKYRR